MGLIKASLLSIMVDMESEEDAKKRLGPYYIPIWEGCAPGISKAIKDFREHWKPYSMSSKPYSIVRLIHELLDPAISAYLATLPARYSAYFPGAGTGTEFSEILRLIGFDAMVRVQRQLLNQFIKTGDQQTTRDQRFVASFESLIGLVNDCGRKRPLTSTAVKGVSLNAERKCSFCAFCGNLSEFAAFMATVAEEKINDVELENRKKLELSHQYCNRHRPKLSNGEWNPIYRQAKRTLHQFEIELARLSRQSARPSAPQAAASGDQLVDSYYYRYLLRKGIQPADKAVLRNLARLIVDNKLSDTKKKILVLLHSGFNQSAIANQLQGNEQKKMTRQAVSKALASIPDVFDLRKPNRHWRIQI